MNYELGASILAADYSKMGQELADLEEAGVDYIHWDVMDNRFVPNLTFGWDLISCCRKWTNIDFEVHLMAHETGADIQKYVDAGCQRIIVQPEAHTHVHTVLQTINNAGVKSGFAINPGTSLTTIDELIPMIDTLLVMTVNPGFGGQDFIGTMINKIRRAKELIRESKREIRLEIDGGLKPHNVTEAVAAGAQAVVCGSGLFGPEGKHAAVAAMRKG